MYRIYLIATFAVASAFAQEIPAPPAAVQVAGRGFLRAMKELPNASFSSWYPLYAPATTRVAFWEGRITTPAAAESGYAIFRADGYLAEYSPKGAPLTSNVLRMAGSRAVRISRFGPHYLAAVNAQGQRMFGDGQFPKLMIDNLTGMPLPPENVLGGTRDGDKFIPKPMDKWQVRAWATEEVAFQDYVANYTRWFENPPQPATPLDLFGKVQSLMDPNPFDDKKDGATTDGATQNKDESATLAMLGWRRWDQLQPNDPLNTDKGYASGCGGQSFLTLFNWHDINVTPQLLIGDPSQENYPDVNKAMYMNDLREWLGTFESFGDLGATAPWNMTEGVDYARFKLGHYTDWVMAYNSIVSSGLAGSLVRDMVTIYGKPMIIGYWSDVHYDVVDEVKTVNGARQFHIRFGENGKWINEADIFFAGGAFDFRSIGNAAGYNHGFEHGMNGWHYDVTGGAKLTVRLRDTEAFQGTGFARLFSKGNNLPRLWKRIDAGNGGITHYEVKARVRVAGSATAWVQARGTEGMPATSLPNGPILASATRTPLADNVWQEVTLTVPYVPSFNFEVQFLTAPGVPGHVDVDALDVRAVFKEQPPVKLPCIMGKPGLDEGCDN
jgi:hypothetical protein